MNYIIRYGFDIYVININNINQTSAWRTMPVVAILNGKGGSGKSTLSTNIAAWCASAGHQVMLGDVDRQQSVRSWLRRRSPTASHVTTWALDNGKVFRAPPGTTHVVLDTPGALYDHELAKLIVWVDAVVVPVGPSIFDQDASLRFLNELLALPKVRSGRCQVAVVGMRWPMDRIEEWKDRRSTWPLQLLTAIPDSAHYRCYLETGSSLFDEPHMAPEKEQEYWRPLTQWLEGVWQQHPVAHGNGERLKQGMAKTEIPTNQNSAKTNQTEPLNTQIIGAKDSNIPAYLLKQPATEEIKESTQSHPRISESSHPVLAAAAIPDATSQQSKAGIEQVHDSIHGTRQTSQAPHPSQRPGWLKRLLGGQSLR